MKKQGVRVILLMMADMMLIVLAFALACSIEIDIYGFENYASTVMKYFPIIILVYIGSLWIFKMYKRSWKTVGIDKVMYGFVACTLACVITYIIFSFLDTNIPKAITITSWIIITGMITIIRNLYGIFRMLGECTVGSRRHGKEKVLIVGAGVCGEIVIKEIQREKADKYKIIGLIDDDEWKQNTYIKGYKVLGGREEIEKISLERKIDTIIIAIPSLNEDDKKDIIEICNKTRLKIKIMPSVYEIFDGRINFNQIKDVDLKDLLGRKEVSLDKAEISKYIFEKRILVTGAGGSIGSELCRQIAEYNPSKLILLDIYENNIYNIQNELNSKMKHINKSVLIGSIRDRGRIEEIFKEYKPQVVFHAAAHKHVPLMEDNPSEAIKNNVCGTLNLVELSHEYKIEKFVLISTDKAVNPTNVMGATKRLCEMIIQAMNKVSDTEFVGVRFGNVLGSNGSVIPLFQKQIEEGGPITLTHPEITRFFMLIPEAAKLVLQAGAYASGGEIFVLDMGKQVKIYDLAENLIRLSGLEPHKEIKIEIIGLRPGEKLYEELLMDEEGLTSTSNEKIFIGKAGDFDIDEIKKSIEYIVNVCISGSNEEIKTALKGVVKTYRDAESINKG